MDHKKTKSFMFIAACALAAFACSGQGGEETPGDLAPLDSTREVSMDSEEREAEFQRQHAAPLSTEEMVAVESRLRELGIDMTEVAFSGRMLAYGPQSPSAGSATLGCFVRHTPPLAPALALMLALT